MLAENYFSRLIPRSSSFRLHGPLGKSSMILGLVHGTLPHTGPDNALTFTPVLRTASAHREWKPRVHIKCTKEDGGNNAAVDPALCQKIEEIREFQSVWETLHKILVNMDEVTVEDEKKRFEPEAPTEEDVQPDPDEELMLDRGNGRVWLVKIPKHLMTRWAAIDKEDVHLATIRIYQNSVSASGRSPRIFLFLPPDPNDPTPRTPDLPSFPPDAAYIPTGENGIHVDRYELDMVNEAVENQLVVAERPKDPVPPPPGTAAAHTYNPRARTTILTGRIKHECSLRPLFNELYRRQMRERSRAYNTPRRQIRMIEEAGLSGGRGGINRLSSGVATGSFADMIKTKPKPVKGTFERMARLPRNQLLDLLFQLFREQPRWSFKPLRERTQQPEVYLKEILNEIAILHRSGEHNGMWELSEIFAREGVKAENVPGPSTGEGSGDVAMEDYDEEEEDEDEDMEEVS